MGQSWPLFVYFCPFFNTTSIIQIEKSVDGVLGIRTRGCRIVGARETMELWRPPIIGFNKRICGYTHQWRSSKLDMETESVRLNHNLVLQENFLLQVSDLIWST